MDGIHTGHGDDAIRALVRNLDKLAGTVDENAQADLRAAFAEFLKSTLR